MSHHNIPREEIPSSEPPPSYEESLVPQYTPTSAGPPHQAQNPHSQYLRPPVGQFLPPPEERPQASPIPPKQQPKLQQPPQGQPYPGVSGSSSANLYSNNSSLPYEYPKGYFCKKCKNVGFRENGKPCKPCWDKFFRDGVYNPRPEIGFRFPRGFICGKCANTGIKCKNGRMCMDCCSFYGPRNKVQTLPMGGFELQNIMAPIPPGIMGGGPAVRLPPGDPRLGGIICERCRGRGQVQFFLDTDICSVCGGLGRILI